MNNSEQELKMWKGEKRCLEKGVQFSPHKAKTYIIYIYIYIYMDKYS